MICLFHWITLAFRPLARTWTWLWITSRNRSLALHSLCLRPESLLVGAALDVMGGLVAFLLTDILFVLNAVVVIVHWIVGVMNACRGPWRRWSLTLNYVSRLLVRVKKKSTSAPETLSSSGPQAPSVDVDQQIRAHIATFSRDVDDRLASMSSSIMTRLDELFS